MTIGPSSLTASRPRSARVAALAAVAAALALAACGSDGGRTATTVATTVAPPASPYAAPPSVPRQGTGPADAADRAIIDRWLAALRTGDEVAAARFFAPGAKVQNASRIFTVRSLPERVQFQRVLSCGAIDREAVDGGHDFTIVTFLLVERPGADCGGGAGHEAKAAIQVRGGRITGWYRLPGGSYQGPEGPQVQA